MPKTATPAKTRAPLTRERVIDAALHIMDTEGLDAVSMRRVAREVGVEAMSLYNHVRDKDDLLNAVIERVMGGFVFPDRGDDDWVAYGRRLAYAWRDVLRTHPTVMQLFAERKHGSSLDTMQPMEAALQVLRSAGLGEREAVQAFHTIGGFIFGYVMMESGYLPGGQPGEQAFPPVPADRLPNVAACMPYLADCDFDEEFAFGLDLMLEGLRAKINAS
jgi:AcrR family transcriptional regulator